MSNHSRFHRLRGRCTQAYSISGRINWTLSEISAFHSIIQELKFNVMRVLGAYQKAGMGTMKLHMLDHVTEYIVRIVVFICVMQLYANIRTQSSSN